MPVARISFPLSMELLSGGHNTSDLAEQAEQNRLQIVKGKPIRGRYLAHVFGEEDGAVGRVQADYLVVWEWLWSSTPIQRFAHISFDIKRPNPGNKFVDKGSGETILVA